MESLVRRLPALVVFLAGSASVASPLTARTQAAWSRVDSDQARFQGAGFKPTSRNVTQMGRTKRTFTAEIVGRGTKVFVRLPRVGVPQAVRRHNVMRVMADELGRPDLVPPAALVTLSSDIGNGEITIGDKVRKVARGTPIMVVEDVGTDFAPYKDFMDAGDATAASHFSEDTRVVTALLHLLTRQLDGNSTNVLLRQRDGSTRLIDHDVSLGIKHTGQEIRGSVFFPRRPLGYAGAQARFEDLPSRAQTLVRGIAEASSSEVASAYRLRADEAQSLQRMAKRVRQVGLSAAIKEFQQEFPNLKTTRKEQAAQGKVDR
jgi:hypothetical protein